MTGANTVTGGAQLRIYGADTPKYSSNIELLRILAMICIVSGHFMGQGGSPDYPYFASPSRIAVNIFLMIGTYFMVEQKSFKASRIIKLYAELWFYQVLLTLVMHFVNGASLKLVVKAFFPLMFRDVWFGAVYIFLLLLAPYLKRFINTLEECELRHLVILLFLLVSCLCTVSKFFDSYLGSLAWFVFMYIFMSWFKCYILPKLRSKYIFLFIGCGIYAAMAICKFVAVYNVGKSSFVLPQSLLSKMIYIINQYLSDYRSIPNFVIALCIFVFFLKIDIGSKKVINCIAANAFGVYIIHQVPAFHDFLWKSIFHCEQIWTSDFRILYTIAVICMTYIGGMIIDKLRVKFIEPIMLNNPLCKRISLALDDIYGTTK